MSTPEYEYKLFKYKMKGDIKMINFLRKLFNKRKNRKEKLRMRLKTSINYNCGKDE